MVKENEELTQKAESLDSLTREYETCRVQLQDLQEKHMKVLEDLETRSEELEAKSTEVDVLKEAVDQLKALVNAEPKARSESETDGWECEDDRKYRFSFSAFVKKSAGGKRMRFWMFCLTSVDT